MYGLMLLLGIAACIWLTGRRWVSWGGDWDLVFRVALWGVVFGYYQPTFLYEFIWDLIGVGVLLWVDRRFTLRRPALFALYVIWYTTFRTFEEILRIDPSNHFAGMRVNFWVSLGIWLVAVVFFV